jgi:hypothetical protein
MSSMATGRSSLSPPRGDRGGRPRFRELVVSYGSIDELDPVLALIGA